MPEAAPAGLMRALGRLVRGLSTLFWGLGLTGLVYAGMVYVETSRSAGLAALGPLAFAPALAASVMMWHGLNQLRAFQAQERIWRRAVDRAEVLAVVDAGLAPFLYGWHKFPREPHFEFCTGALFVSSLLLLAQTNGVLRRLSAMVPDETLRGEAKLFTKFNFSALAPALGGPAAYFLLSRMGRLPEWTDAWMETAGEGGIWLTLFLVLMPLTMTMALVWKIKEVIFSGVIEAERPP